MNRPSQPRWEGPLRRRWRARQWLRCPDLAAACRKDIIRSDDLGPYWTEVVEDAVLAQDLEWIEDAQRQPNSFIRPSAASM